MHWTVKLIFIIAGLTQDLLIKIQDAMLIKGLSISVNLLMHQEIL